MCNNINISKKITLFRDHFEKVIFSQYIRKHQYFQNKEITFKNRVFRKDQHIEEKKSLYEITF